MNLRIQASIKNNENDPGSLQDGHLLQVCSGLSGVIAIADQRTDFEAKLNCIGNSLKAQYGDSNVVYPLTPPSPLVYKLVLENGEWVMRCVIGATLEISQKRENGSTLVILLELEGSMPFVP
jgi:hypothetical protein